MPLPKKITALFKHHEFYWATIYNRHQMSKRPMYLALLTHTDYRGYICIYCFHRIKGVRRGGGRGGSKSPSMAPMTSSQI